MARSWPLVLASTLAAAAAIVPRSAAAEVEIDEFSPVHLQQLVGLDDFTYDSDWFPADAPVQLRLIVHAGNSVLIDMPGDGVYDWETSELTFEGEPDAGRFGVDVGFTLESLVRFDVAGLTWESDIIGPYDYAVISEADFTPYLLEGNPDRPATINDMTDPVTLVEVPVTPDIIVASGHLDIDIYLIIEGELRGEAIEVATLDPKAQWQAIVEEGAAALLDPGPGPLPDPFLVDGVLFAELRTEPTIVLKPTLVMTILGKDYEIADIDIPVTIPAFDDSIQFATINMSFPRPPPPPEPETTGASSDSDSDSNSSSDSGTDSGTESSASAGPGGDGSATASDTDTDSGGFDGVGEEGCACSVGDRDGDGERGRQGPPLWFGLVVLIAARRRRARA